MSKNITIEEVTHHGDFRHVRRIEVHRLIHSTVESLMTGGPYPVTNTKHEVVQGVMTDLIRFRRAEHGWVTWTIIPDETE